MGAPRRLELETYNYTGYRREGPGKEHKAGEDITFQPQWNGIHVLGDLEKPTGLI